MENLKEADLMWEARISEHGKDKLKKLAKYESLEYYPIVHMWHDLHTTEPRKFILYFAMPDDRGNTFVIPAKWCEDLTEVDDCKLAVSLNDSALEQLGKVGKFSTDYIYPVIQTWHTLSTKDPNKKKFDVFYAILNAEKKIFIVQSTWGKLVCLDEKGNPLYVK
jgi:hypothetical protein